MIRHTRMRRLGKDGYAQHSMCWKFSSDRTIEEYAKEIWKLKKVKVSLDK